MKILSIGKLTYDVNILLDDFLVESSETATKEMITCSGGSANVVAYSLGKWNVDSFISGVIGYDEIGTSMKKNMEDSKIRTNYLETNYDIKTPTSYIIINKKNNSKTIINTEFNNYNIKKYEYDTDMDCVIVDGYEYNASIYAFNKYSNAITILNAKKPHNGLLDFFKYAKYVVCSSDVAEAMTGLKIDFNNPITMSSIYKKIVDTYPHITLFITMKDKGTIYMVHNEIKVLASIKTDIVDNIGAEDIFVAMIGYGLTSGYDVETTIRLATIAESLSKKVIGSTLGIPLLSEIINYYETKFGPIQANTAEKETGQATVASNPVEETAKVVSTPNQEVVNNTPEPVKEDSTIVADVFHTPPVDVNNENNNAPSA